MTISNNNFCLVGLGRLTEEKDMSIIDIKNVTFGYDGCEQNVFENLTAAKSA